VLIDDSQNQLTFDTLFSLPYSEHAMRWTIKETQAGEAPGTYPSLHLMGDAGPNTLLPSTLQFKKLRTYRGIPPLFLHKPS